MARRKKSKARSRTATSRSLAASRRKPVVSRRRLSTSHRHPRAVYENPPGPYVESGGYLRFHDGHQYKINRTTVAQAARYLNKVKEAEDHGKAIPRGPYGISPGAAAVLVHFGRKKKRRRAGACKPCAVPRRHRAKKRKLTVKRRKPMAVKRRTAPKRRYTRRPTPKRLPAPRRARSVEHPDVWDFVYDTYGRR